MGEAILLIVYFTYYLFVLAYGAYAYIGVGLGGFRMARKAGMNNPWLFWIPVANIYATGALADRQTRLCEGKTTNYAKKLLTWNIIIIAMIIVLVLSTIPMIVVSALNSQMDENGVVQYPEAEVEALVVPILIFLAALVAFFVLFIIYLVVYFKVMYKIFKLFAPDGAAGLTVLSVFVDIAIPAIFLILSKRNPVLPFKVEEDHTYVIPDAPSQRNDDFYTL